MQDAQDVMDMLVKVQNEQGDMEPDDPQVRTKIKLITISADSCQILILEDVLLIGLYVGISPSLPRNCMVLSCVTQKFVWYL